MKKFTSIIISIALSVTTICAMCSCAPQLPQFVYVNDAYFDYKIITDEDLMNIACIAGEGPLKKAHDEDGSHYEPIEFTQTVEFAPISDEEYQAVRTAILSDKQLCQDVSIGKSTNFYFFGEYNGYYALGIYDQNWSFIPEIYLYDYVGDIHWKRTTEYEYLIFIYTTPQKTKIK